jgi:hypothetical protein
MVKIISNGGMSKIGTLAYIASASSVSRGVAHRCRGMARGAWHRVASHQRRRSAVSRAQTSISGHRASISVMKQ